jgi:pyruvate dehydrogenase E2 component (dihydrolipoamide acetyltransferase)
MSTQTKVTVVMPQMGVSVAEGTILRWCKSEGDPVQVDEPLAEISTDKIDSDVPSPCAGVVERLLAGEGETVQVGAEIAIIRPPGVTEAAPPPPVAVPPAVGDPSPADVRRGSDGFVSPVAARLAAEHGIDLATVAGSGRDGRVTRRDIEAAVDARRVSAAGRAPMEDAAEWLQPLSRMRLAIAEHMRRSLDTSAHVTTTFEVDLTRVGELRRQLRPVYAREHGVALTHLAFVARATVEALRHWPWLNGELREADLLVRTYVNLGVAVAVDGGRGLVVPVLEHAEQLDLAGFARRIADVAGRAREGRLRPAEIGGGTFTVTNPGGWGGLLGTPIINQPQLAVLAVEGVAKRPAVVTGPDGVDRIEVRELVNLCLSYDHRVIDGAYAAQFMRELKLGLETRDAAGYERPTVAG